MGSIFGETVQIQYFNTCKHSKFFGKWLIAKF